MRNISKMLYSSIVMNNGYQITQKDIDSTITYLKTQKLSHSKEDAIKFLNERTTIAHVIAHQIVKDEQSGKIKKVKTK